MSIERTLRIIQVAYPQVYLACHTRHRRRPLLLTAGGLAAIRETSVLEAPRLRAVLQQLSADELRAVARE